MDNTKDKIIILGGGLTGLSAGYVLTKAGLSVKVFESDSTVGGLSKTIIHNGFRFDLGGHRFFTKDRELNNFVKELMREELISVQRKSKIYMRNKYFDYPLKPLNAIFGLGISTTIEILLDYAAEKIKNLVRKSQNISLEDWVVGNFGRKMFNIYFKEYSEKVWGIDCSRISAEWVAQRIRGLSLASAVKNAFFKLNGRDVPSLVDVFLYPQLGIGRISDRLKEDIEAGNNSVLTDSRIERINHSDFKVESIVINNRKQFVEENGIEFISSIPITKLVNMLRPAPPENILTAASKLRFRDLVIVAVMINRKRVTDQTWIYIPEQKIPFGRLHEPTNWSEKMAPEGKTILVAEFFSFKGEGIWNKSDEELTAITVENLENMGFVKKHEIIGSVVVKVLNAYPLFEVGYKERCDEIYDYLGRFKNLHITGRSGMFRYYNMDHAIESGIKTAEKIIKAVSCQLSAIS
ncbi:MAG: FAD-dependent oxidoreductase [Nitrospirae bacterium]|nr:FAD-dependent oxidoreductase [Nitrospirota bacterium]MBI3378982.1 FAD-dependent oxidoreductase [Nitrospirota bacterium]